MSDRVAMRTEATVETSRHSGESAPLTPSPSRSRLKLLYVDEAVAFGGSLIIAGALVSGLDKGQFRSSVVTAFRDEFTSRIFAGAERAYVRSSWLSYATMEALRERIARGKSRLLRKVSSLALSLMDSLASAVHCLSLVGLIAAKRIQVVHTNNSIEAAVAGIITGRPVVFHLHGTFSEALPSRLRWVFRRCAVVVAISAYVRDSAASAGIDAARIEIVPNGTELQATNSTRASEIRLRLGVPPDAPLVALVGRIVPWKGHREFLLAAIEVYKTHPNAHFVLVGGVSDGSPKFLEELRCLAREAGIDHALHCTGYVADVSAHVEAATIIVHASIEPEPFGLVIVEGMAAARPVIVSALGAGPEIVTDGVDGFIVDPRLPAELAGAICRLIADPALAARVGSEALKTVEKEYGIDAMVRSFERIYRRIAKAPV